MKQQYLLTWLQLFRNWKYLLLLVSLTVATSFIFTWFFSLDVVLFVVNSNIDFNQKILFFIGSITSVYGDIFSPYSVMFMLFSFIFASNITLLIYLSRHRRTNKNNKLSSSTMGAGLIGAGCIACGGSIITPVLGMAGVGATAQLSQTISLMAFLLASLFGLFGVKKLLTQMHMQFLAQGK